MEKIENQMIIKNKEANEEPKMSVKFAQNVRQYTKESYSQQFVNYRNIAGQQSISIDIIDGLYDSTIFNRLLNKIASDAIPDMYTIQIVDVDGNRLTDLEQECRVMHANLTRQNLRYIFRDMLKYGSTCTYIGDFQDGVLQEPFNLDIQNVEPKINTSEGTIDAWVYNDGDNEIEIPPEQIMFFALDPLTGEIFGRSMLGPIIHILHLFLNTELNLSEIVDKFVIPILSWIVKDESVNDQKLTQLANSIMNQYQQGDDIILAGDISTEVIGAAQSQFDLVPILHELKETLGIMTVPFQILGGKADNLSSSTVQLKTYLQQIGDYQSIVSDGLVRNLYKPFLTSLGKESGLDYQNIYINFPRITIETPSESIKAIIPAVQAGLMDREEARSDIGLRGVPVPIDEIEITQLQVQAPQNKDGRGGDPNNEPSQNSGDNNGN